MKEDEVFSCGFEVIERMLERNKKAYQEAPDTSHEARNTFNHVVGNCAILAVHEEDEVFNAFIDWLKKYRNEARKGK